MLVKIEFFSFFLLALTTAIHSIGAWGCFDEFNRIDLSVLSVISSQLQTIRSGLLANQETFVVKIFCPEVLFRFKIFHRHAHFINEKPQNVNLEPQSNLYLKLNLIFFL